MIIDCPHCSDKQRSDATFFCETCGNCGCVTIIRPATETTGSTYSAKAALEYAKRHGLKTDFDL